MQASADTHDTALSSTPWGAAGGGLGTTDHAVPFHDSTSVFSAFELFVYWPTAVHAVADTHDTPLRIPPSAGDGLGTTDQVVPFHDSTSVPPS